MLPRKFKPGDLVTSYDHQGYCEVLGYKTYNYVDGKIVELLQIKRFLTVGGFKSTNVYFVDQCRCTTLDLHKLRDKHHKEIEDRIVLQLHIEKQIQDRLEKLNAKL